MTQISWFTFSSKIRRLGAFESKMVLNADAVATVVPSFLHFLKTNYGPANESQAACKKRQESKKWQSDDYLENTDEGLCSEKRSEEWE